MPRERVELWFGNNFDLERGRVATRDAWRDQVVLLSLCSHVERKKGTSESRVAVANGACEPPQAPKIQTFFENTKQKQICYFGVF